MKNRRSRRLGGLFLLLASANQALMVGTAASPRPAGANPRPAAAAQPVAPAPAAPVQAPAAAPGPLAAPVLADDLGKELAKGTLIAQLEKKGKLPKRPYAPPDKLIRPYAGASLGAPVAYALVEGTEFVSAPAAEALAQSVLDRLLRGLSVPQPNIRVEIVAEPFYGALATETGLILVSLGTFDPERGAANVDELALLLGHEVSHLLLGHMESGRTMRGVVNALSYSAGAFLSYSAMKDSHVVNGRLQAAGDKGMMMSGLAGGLAASTLVGDLLTPSFGRGHELEADRLGVDLARRAGYVVTESETNAFVTRHAEDNLRRSQRMQNLQLVLNAVTAQVAAAAAKQTGQFGNLTKSLISVVGNVLSDQLLKAIASQTRNHPNVEERKLFLSQYVARNYPNGDTGPDGSIIARDFAGLRRVSGSPQFMAVLDQVRRAHEVRRLISETTPSADGSPPPALAAIVRGGAAPRVFSPAPTPRSAKGKAARPRFAALPPSAPAGLGTDAAAFTWDMQGVVRFSQGDSGGAQEAWRRGLRLPYASPEMARRLSGPGPQAAPPAAELEALLAHYRTLVGTTDPLLDLVVLAAVAKGDAAAAEVAAARCVTYDGGRLYSRCAAMLGYNPMAKGESAKTPEGVRAFAGKSMEKSFHDLLAITSIFQ